MKHVLRNEVLELGPYEQIREPFRRRIIELKRLRRVQLGTNITAIFENRDTVLYQVQEMLRTERITREEGILHELSTYNELLPAAGELSATVFLEYPDREERERMLVALVGIEHQIYLEVGGSRIEARSETRGVLPGRTTAVQYTKISLLPAVIEALRSGKVVVALGIDHPAYGARTELPPRTVEELVRDLE